MGQLVHYPNMMQKALLLIVAAGALNACDAADTRAKRLAAIEEVERACRIPKGTIDRMVADEPASDGQSCDPIKKQCEESRFIHLGNADFEPNLLCRFSCIKGYRSSDGYNFGLYLHSINVRDEPQTDNC
jgi:hypothetical protein